MLFRVISLVGMVLLAVVLERGMFWEQFRCSIIIDGKTFEAVIDVRKVKGVLIDVCTDIYVMMSSDLYGTCSSANVIVVSHTNSNLPHRCNCNPCIGGPCRLCLQYL